MSKTTIRDVARAAGVCIATVSRVINDCDNVQPDTKQRVLDAIKRLAYSPNAIGRGLVLRRSQNILLELFNMADPYCVALSEGIGGRARSLGYKMLLADCKFSATLEAEHLTQVRDGSIDGLIISPLPVRDNIPLFKQLVRANFPIVVMDNHVPTVKMNCVKYDDRLAGSMAMDYLFEKGHKNIIFLQWRTGFHTVQDRRRSFMESHRKRNIPLNPDYIVTMPDEFRDWDQKIFRRLLDMPSRPTAILAENEISAVACMNILLQCGKRIPDDIAVMAIGDTLLDSLVPVPLTTVSLHPEQAAQKAVELLTSLIENPAQRRECPSIYVQKPSLVVRRSA